MFDLVSDLCLQRIKESTWAMNALIAMLPQSKTRNDSVYKEDLRFAPEKGVSTFVFYVLFFIALCHRPMLYSDVYLECVCYADIIVHSH